MKKVLALIFSLFGLIAIFTYIGILINRIMAINTGGGIIGGAGTPTFLFLINESPIALAIIGVVSLVLGVVLFFKKNKF